MTEREMTLNEWCERLHPAHLVNRQLVALKKNIKLENYGKWAEPIALAGVKGCLDAAEEENIRLNARIKELEAKLAEHESKLKIIGCKTIYNLYKDKGHHCQAKRNLQSIRDTLQGYL